MSASINGREIESQYVEYGVLFSDNTTFAADDETEARTVARLGGGKLVARTVYETGWAEITE